MASIVLIRFIGDVFYLSLKLGNRRKLNVFALRSCLNLFFLFTMPVGTCICITALIDKGYVSALFF